MNLQQCRTEPARSGTITNSSGQSALVGLPLQEDPRIQRRSPRGRASARSWSRGCRVSLDALANEYTIGCYAYNSHCISVGAPFEATSQDPRLVAQPASSSILRRGTQWSQGTRRFWLSDGFGFPDLHHRKISLRCDRTGCSRIPWYCRRHRCWIWIRCRSSCPSSSRCCTWRGRPDRTIRGNTRSQLFWKPSCRLGGRRKPNRSPAHIVALTPTKGNHQLTMQPPKECTQCDLSVLLLL